MKKQSEGDNEQRRARAAEARKEGRSPSEAGVTTGASKQDRSLGSEAEHEERIRGSGHGKQQPERAAPDPRPGSIPTPAGQVPPRDTFAPRDGDDRARPGDLDETDQRVFEALARLETADSAPTAGELARAADLPPDALDIALQRLIGEHDVVQELPADPQTGHRYRVKARS